MFRTHHGLRFRRFRFILLSLLLISITGTALAQGGTALTNGSVVTGAITDQAKLSIYGYSGNPGDVITAQVIGLTPGMNPTVSLMSPTQQQLATNDNDPFSIAGSTNARITYRLKEAGAYSILVGGTNGQFVLQFSVRQPAQATSLQQGTPAAANIMPGAAPQIYNFGADSGAQTVLTLGTTSPNFAFTAQIFDNNGQLLAIMSGPTMQTAALTVAPGSDLYEIVLAALSPNMQGSVSLLIAKGSAATAATPDAAAATPTLVAPPPTLVPTVGGAQAPAGVCSATPLENSAINIRSGPSTLYPVTGQLMPSTFLIIQGRNSDSTWLVNVDGGIQRWVSVSVVKLSGPCDNLSIVTPPLPPTPIPPTNTPTPVPPTNTSTFTPTATFTKKPLLIVTIKPPIVTIKPLLPSKTFTPTRTPTKKFIVITVKPIITFKKP